MAVRSADIRGIGWAIRKVRKAQDRTLEDIAAAVGSDAGNLSRIERGAQDAPEATLRAIAGELGLSMSQLWLAAEGGDDALAETLAAIGRLNRDGLEELAVYAHYLLTRHPRQ